MTDKKSLPIEALIPLISSIEHTTPSIPFSFPSFAKFNAISSELALKPNSIKLISFKLVRIVTPTKIISLFIFFTVDDASSIISLPPKR